ncbi:hypothetical protein NYR75_00100 [Actinobacillus equuli subsp. haemolyticus]|uniref:hypothetical protein n=1 Tax=Actinobacillus equuli TaxID=718 RepID=UPI0024420A18|nr:hypothetical protein [Actinobacillus equuli]WGE50834.1 hypothetical protein NYR68_00105 [Actinobacillus equuli subsp. haemolyticus]WGE63268.1 hypothetical protein NYR75_00100 [Actinobacillus equuli subsp. haemolyticus]
MKKLLGISTLAVLLAACSSPNEPTQVSQVTEADSLAKVEEALKACQESVGESKDQIEFDACMREKGFERPAMQQEQFVQEEQTTVKENAATAKSGTKKAVKKVKSSKTK